MRDFEASVEKLVELEVNRRLRKLYDRLSSKIDKAGAPRGKRERRVEKRVEKVTNGKVTRFGGSRKNQGRYMAVVRGLNSKQKAEIRAVRQEKGIVAAIDAAKKLAEAG